MINFVYNIIINLFWFFSPIFSFFNTKFKNWIIQQKNWKTPIQNNNNTCWFVVASAGEFEQAIPIIQLAKKKYSITVSFFSKSGFDMYKNNNLIDCCFYFPLDTKKNAKQLVKLINPKLVIFIKNEFWLHTLTQIKQQNIPLFLINAENIFAKNIFYNLYLKKCTSLFTKIFETKIYGNTKIEKAIQNKNTNFNDPKIELFCKNSFVIIVGSSYEIEEKMIANFYKNTTIKNLKIIICPHEINKNRIQFIQQLFNQKTSLYSHFSNTENTLLIDQKGILKYIYKYANIAFIGGGFSKQTHNVTEATIFETPTIFGPNYTKFNEIIDLINNHLAFEIKDKFMLSNFINNIYNDANFSKNLQKKIAHYYKNKNNISLKIWAEIMNLID